MAGAVVLEGLRCDGSLHGGCQLGCMLFWKEAWLRAAPAGRPVVSPAEPDPAPELRVASRSDPYVCQATALREATTPGDSLWKPGQYLRFLKVRTFSLSGLLAMFARAGGRKVAWQFRSLRHRDATTGARREAALGLRPGEWVEVKSRDEILRTLDARRMHGGFSFGGDMYEQCGRRLRVQRRVDRTVEEATGRLRPVDDTVILEGSICDRYFGCARAIPFQWQEVWLKRVESGPSKRDLPTQPAAGSQA
jgi:hypothetical protein